MIDDDTVITTEEEFLFQRRYVLLTNHILSVLRTDTL